MKQFKLVLNLLALIFIFGSVVHAQDKGSEPSAVELKKTVVTATRTETSVENLPVSVTVITRDDIEKMHAKTVDDVLNKAAGVQIRRNKGLSNTGSHTTLYMRGTGSTSRVLILKDGIPLNSTYIGSVNIWGSMSVEDIEKIEIVRGASSALYGSSAMGGVINIITSSAKKGTTGSVSLEGGTFDTYVGNANIRTSTDRFGLRASAGHKRTDGYEYYKGDQWKSYYITPENKLTNVSLGGDIWLGESVLKLDYEYFLEDSLVATASQYDGEDITHNFMLSYGLPLWGTDFSIKSYYFDYAYKTEARRDSTPGEYVDFYYDSDVPKDEWGLMLQASKELGNNRLTVGSDLKWGKCDSNYTYINGERNFSGEQELYSFFANDELFIGDKLILNAGVRYDHWKNYGADFYDDTSGTVRRIDYPNTTDDAWSPKAGVVYKLTEDSKLRASFSSGFKAPSLYYLYKSGPHGATRFDLANPDLGPEKMPWSYDVGFDIKPNENLKVGLTWYQSRFKDFMGDKTLDPSEVPPWFTPDPGMTVIQKVNMGRVDIHGVEAALEYAFDSRWSAFVNYTYNVSKIKKYEEDPSCEGNYLSYTPRHMTKIGFIYDNPALFTFSTFLTNIGERYGNLENDDNRKLEAYQVIDVRVSRKLFKGMELFLSIDNLTDEEYSEYRTSTTVTYNPPRTVMLGAKYNF